MEKSQFNTIFSSEVRRSFSDPLNIKLLLLLAPVIALSLWPYTPSPLLPALVAAFLASEPRFANSLFGSAQEGEALYLLPRSWYHVIAAKNLSAGVVALVYFLLFAFCANYVVPVPAGAEEWGIAICAFCSVLPCLFHLGNLHAVDHPRRRWTWSLGDAAEGILFMVSVAISAIPFLCFLAIGIPIVGTLLFTPFAILFWLRVSLPRTALALRGPGIFERVEE